MSYNISVWKTKSLGGFAIPWSELFKPIWLGRPEIIDSEHIRIGGFPEGFCIEGRLDSDWLQVDKFQSWGEASGSCHQGLLDLLSTSMGYLEAVLIWECGDSIERLIVNDGEVETIPIEL